MVIAVQVISVISLIMCIFLKSSVSILINCDAHLMVFIRSFILVINYKKLYRKNMVPCFSWVLWTTRRSCFAFKSGKSEILMVLPRRHESCCQQHTTPLNIQMPHSCSCCVVAYLSYEVFSPLCQAFNCRINLTGSAGLSWLIYLTWLTVTAYRGSCMKCLIVKHSFLSISGFLSASDYPGSLQESCRQPFTWSWYLCQD